MSSTQVGPDATANTSATAGGAASAGATPAVAPDGSKEAIGIPLFGGIRIGWDTLLTTLPIYIGLIIIWAYFDTQTGGKFTSPRNLSNMVQEFSYKPVLALGVVFVLLLGEIDLSLSYLTLLGAAVTAQLSQNFHWATVPAVGGGLVVCALLGLAQGFLISWVRMPAFVVTLGGFLIFEGIADSFLTQTINVLDPNIDGLATTYLPNAAGWIIAAVVVAAYVLYGLNTRRARARYGLTNPPLSRFLVSTAAVAVLLALIVLLANNYLGIPLPLAILGAFAVFFWFFARRTRFGRHIYAVGGNLEAARRAGINTTAVRWFVFGLSGLMAGFAGLMLIGQSQSVSPQSATPDLLLDVISIAVIGGVSLTGGKGSVWAVLLGGLVIASVDSGLQLMNTDPNLQFTIKGAILLLAILIDVVGKRRGGLAVRRS